jgi:hypothetical protein
MFRSCHLEEHCVDGYLGDYCTSDLLRLIPNTTYVDEDALHTKGICTFDQPHLLSIIEDPESPWITWSPENLDEIIFQCWQDDLASPCPQVNEYCRLHMFLEGKGIHVYHARLAEICPDGGQCERTAYVVVPSWDADRLVSEFGFTIVSP